MSAPVGQSSCHQCSFAAVGGFDECFAHLRPGFRESALKQMQRSALFDLTRTRVDHEGTLELSRALAEGRPRVKLDNAQIDGPLNLSGPTELQSLDARGAKFLGPVVATDLTVTDHTDFSDAVFEERVLFGRDREGRYPAEAAIFHGPASFRGAVAEAEASFRRVHFLSAADFRNCTFRARSAWAEALFLGSARFQDSQFHDTFSLRAATVVGNATLHNCVFDGQVWCTGLSCFRPAEPERMREALGESVRREPQDHQLGRISFRQARFAAASYLGSMRAHSLVLAQADSASRLSLTALTNHLALGDADREAPGASFRDGMAITVLPPIVDAADRELVAELADSIGGAELEVENPTVDLTACTFGARSSLAGGSAFPSEFFRERRVFAVGPAQVDASKDQTDTPRLEGHFPLPRVSSLKRADGASLLLGGVSLAGCAVAGAVNLEELSLASTVEIGEGDQVVGRDDQLEPGQRADVYRSLRRATERRGDASGADRLYLLEMAERRRASRPWLGRSSWRRRRELAGEWLVVSLYGLASGYGLRGWRALLCLAVLAAVCGWALAEASEPARSYGDGLVLAAESAVSLSPTAPGPALSDGGEVARVIMRIAGPLFLALALLALRARVKR